MANPVRTFFHALVLLVVLGLLALAAFVWSGIYDVGADTRHTRPVHWVLQTLRERSVEVRADALVPPELGDRARIVQGAGNYHAMCAMCHRAPGMAESELSRGLYPAPPALAEHPIPAREAFWIVKHGIKSTAMPAWGESMEDTYIWNMVAFLQVLPELDARQYRAIVAQSGGHAHDGSTQPAPVAEDAPPAREDGNTHDHNH